ncbi:hypothetical protein ACQ33O_04225 [Ferruginibacter sp. SUN002]|uniref:hypothetical protein n=1 Tax=Ferruginibacter sp. SUN002 TaxID=2937789 RepID=UPI003D361CE0
MKKASIILLLVIVHIVLLQYNSLAQCALCTKTAQQLGEKPALGLNQGILYLMFMPFVVVGVIGYKWWKNNRDTNQ